VTQEALGQFATRVLPILLNTCAGCHASGRGGNFQLIRPLDDAALGRKSLQQNLAAVLAQIDTERVQASPLLARALTVHGEMKSPPLAGRQATAYRTLEDWVRLTLAGNPQARPSAAPAAARVVEPQPRPAVVPPSVSSTAPADAHSSTRESSASLSATPAPTPATPVDPFDPSIFNRRMHPEKR
jgi:hypothetical protein